MKTLQNYLHILCLRNVVAMSVLLVLLSSNFAQSQSRFSLMLGSGANFPTEKLGDANLKTGFGFEGTVSYRFLQHLSVYAGWGWNKFSAKQSFAGSDIDFEETGYTYGLRFAHPIAAESKIKYVIGAGGVYNHIEVEDNKGEVIADSGHGLGWELDAGVSVPIGKHLSIIPGVRYRSLSRRIKTGNVNTSVDLNYISAGVGLSWNF
jgi:hypothetical protein